MLLAAAIALGCISAPDTDPNPTRLAGIEAKTIAIVPLNLVITLPAKLKSSTPIVADALTSHVEENEKLVRLVDFRTARRAWIESTTAVREAGGEETFENAARELSRSLSSQMDFDALIVPSLYVQNARVTEDKAYWDGTKQKIPVVGRSKWEIETPPLNTLEAASILVYVFDRNGEVVHTRRTGLELIQHLGIHVERQQGHDRRIWVPLYDDPAIEQAHRVRAAIAHSLSPFLEK
jgi:hypothetical protein